MTLRILIALSTCLLLAACAHPPERNPLATWVPSKNFNQRKPVIIVLPGFDPWQALARIGYPVESGFRAEIYLPDPAVL